MVGHFKFNPNEGTNLARIETLNGDISAGEQCLEPSIASYSGASTGSQRSSSLTDGSPRLKTANTTELTWSCKLWRCSKRFQSRIGLIHHIDDNHVENGDKLNSYYPGGFGLIGPDKRYHCWDLHCDKSFQRRADYFRHINTHNTGEDKAYECPEIGCPRKGSWGFMRRDKLVDHIRGKHKRTVGRSEFR